MRLRRRNTKTQELTTTETCVEQHGMVMVPIATELATSLSNEWSEPVQMRFEHTDAGWVVWFRTIRQIHEQQVAERASRQ